MTKLQAKLIGMGMVILGVAVAAVASLVLKNDALTILGVGLALSGGTALGIPRPKDIA